MLRMRRHAWGMLHRGLHGLLHRARRAVQGLTVAGHGDACVRGLEVLHWEADAQTLHYTWVSPYAAVLLGYPRAQWWTEPDFWLQHLYHADRDRVVCSYRDQIRAGRDFQCTYRLVAADGRVVWVYALVRLVKDPAGQVRQLRGLLVDLPAYQYEDEAWPAQVTPSHTWFDATPHPMWVYDRETLAFLAVNDAAVAQYGYARDEFLALTLHDMHPPEDIPALLAHVAQTTTRSDASDQGRHRTKDGRLLDVEITAHAVTFAGRPAHVVFAQDITARHQAEAALARRMAQLQTVQTIAAEITRERDLSSLLELIVHRAAELLGAARSVLYLWHEEMHLLHPRAWCHAGEWLSTLTLQLGEGVAGTVAQRREGLIVNDYQQSPYVHPTFLAHVGSVPIMAEPLLYRDRLVGVLVVTQGETGPGFTPSDREFLAMFAAQATIAIEHARLFEESGRRQAWLTSILEMNTRIAMSADLTSLLSRIAAEAARLVGADGANLRILRGDHLMTNSQTQYGLVLPHVPALRLGQGIGGIAARDNRVVVVPDLQAHPDVPEFIKVQAAEVGLSSMVSIPVRSRHRVIGVLSVNSARPRVFTAEESAALAICAEQAAIAIEHTQLVDEVKAQQAALAHANAVLRHEIAARHQAEEALALRIAQMEAVRTIAAEITQELALPTVLDVILRRAVECVDAATEGIIYLWEAADEVLIPHACHGHGAWEARLRTVRLQLGESLTGTVAQRRQGLIVNDYPQSSYVHPQALVAHLGYTAAMAEPLLYRDRLVGVIVLTNGGTKQPFTERDRAFLTLLALHATIAIENARLFEESTARQAWLERTNTSLQHEITERQRVEAERERLMAALEARSTEMERFTYSVSHDLKSPLITIRGFVGLLEQDAVAGDLERMQTDITYINVAATTMQRLLDEVLELSRIGRVVNPLTEVPLSALAHEAVTLVGGQLVTRGVQVHIAPDLPVVVGDRPRLLEVLQNLVDNAVKFMGAQPAPRIDIGVRQTEKEPVYYVGDNGVGIEPRYHEKIFGLFERLEPAGEGTGVGLALVKRIIEVHGGRIWVESAGQGCGSTFCFTLAQHLQ